MRTVVLCLIVMTCGPVFGQQRSGSDWPSFLGPDHTGVSTEKDFLTEWPEAGPPVAWEKKVGTGYSAPSVRGHRLVLHHRLANQELTQCFDSTTGRELWTYKAESDFEDPYKYNNGPRCTPVLSETRCFTLGAGGHLAGLDLETGDELWSRDLHDEYDIPDAFFGVGCTPILEGDKLIVLVGGQPNAGVVAFEAETGKPLWTKAGKETWEGVETPKRGPYEWTGSEQVVSYSSPIAATINGKRHVLCLMRQGLVSLDPETGAENFKYWFRPSVRESVNAARPVVIGNRILLSAAYRLGSVLLEVNPAADGVTEVWKSNTNLLAHWSTPIVVDGYAYGFTGRHKSEGELRCIDLANGKVQWEMDGYDASQLGEVVRRTVRQDGRLVSRFVVKDSGREVPNPLFGRGSKIRVGEHFIILGEEGVLAVAKINSQKYEEVARTGYKQIHDPAWTAPVFSRQRLYLRCEDALICVDLAKPE